MIKIKNTWLIFILTGAFLLGSLGVCALTGLSPAEVFSGAAVAVPRSEYNEYLNDLRVYEKANALRKHISEDYYTDVDDAALDEGMYRGLFEALGDPYSGYLTADEYSEEINEMSGEYGGVGVTMINDEESGKIMVVAVMPKSPAEKAGLRGGDFILKADGESYPGSRLSEAAKHIRGKNGSKVVLTMERDGESFDVELVRSDILIESVTSKMLDGKIGYIGLSGFMENTGKLFEKAVKEFEDEGAKGLVIDLRNNGGGLVDAAVEVADVLMDKASVVYAEDRRGKREYYKTKNGKTGLPFVVLINGGTASSSEILSAGLQSNKACKIVGTKSFGKGIIQQLDPLSDGSAVKLTVMQYFSPEGKVIHKAGITPDYIVDITDDCYDKDGNLISDPQLEKALEILK